MTSPNSTRNQFLTQLLSLQQDGKLAISAPTNWTNHPPLLEVSTDVDGIIKELCDSILIGESKNETARWHFLVGSPGNGKSAAMGKLCRQLMTERGCQVRDESDVSIADLDPTVIPYAINIYEKSNRFASAQIVQDASVVRTPYSPHVDSAAELLKTLKHAWERGISLVVCTNRGVLEKAHRDNHMNPDINTAPWFKIVATIVSANGSSPCDINTARKFDTKKPVFNFLKVGYSYLDNQSLLLGRDTFERLVKKALANTNWDCCTSCTVQGLCPFKANRDWLQDGDACGKVLRLLTRAEVLSGQVIVFREALAIISLILAGCTRDYAEGKHPCDWVKAKAESNDVFSLATRRIYMALLASYCPHGLETFDELRQRQITTLAWLCEAVSQQAREAIERVVKKQHPSTDVGITRLLSKTGVIASLDPSGEALPSDFYDRWDTDYNAFSTRENPFFTEIERRCLSAWREMEEGLELETTHSVSEGHWALRRWSSNFLLHYGTLIEGRSAWAEGLDEFTKLLGLVAKSPQARSIEDKRAIRQLDASLEHLLTVTTGSQGINTIPLSDSVTLSGQWVTEKLKPKTESSETSGSVSLAVRFEGGEKAVFAAPMYLWLSLRVEGKLDPRCFPQELLAGVEDARIRAAAKGNYAFQNDNVELIVNTGTGEQFKLSRFDGDVDVAKHDPLP